MALFRQRLVDVGPSPGAFGIKPDYSRADLAARRVSHVAELFRRHDDGDIEPAPLDAHGFGLR